MKHHRLSFLAAGAVFLAAAPAWAQDPPPPLPAPTVSEKPSTAPVTTDAVHLRNGGLYRGHVTEIVPGDHVTILVDHGDAKKLPWGDIEKVIVATTAIPNGPTAQAGDQVGARIIPPASAPTVAPMNGPKVRVHITSSSTVVLYRRVQGSTAWTQACTSPCNVDLPLGDSYRVNGNGVSQSNEFSLQGTAGSTVDIKVDGSSTAGMVLGGGLTGLGALVGYVGLVALAVSLGDNYHGDEKAARVGGLVAMGLGTVAMVGGLLIFLASAKTDVTQNQTGTSSGKKNGVSPSERTIATDAFRRDPTWRTAEATAPTQFPVLFSHAF